MGMQTQALIVLILCGIFLMLIAVYSWYRRRKIAKKEASANSISRIQETIVNGQRTFRIATVSQQSGQLALDIYEIRLPRLNEPNGVASIRLLPFPDSTTRSNTQYSQPPPPPFSTAINMPSPEDQSTATLPPPTYEEIIPNITVTAGKLPAVGQNNETTNNTSSVSQAS